MLIKNFVLTFVQTFCLSLHFTALSAKAVASRKGYSPAGWSALAIPTAVAFSDRKNSKVWCGGVIFLESTLFSRTDWMVTMEG